MAFNNYVGDFTYGIKFNIDQNELAKVQKSLNSITQNGNYNEIFKLDIKQAAKELDIIQNALTKSYNQALNSFNITTFKNSLTEGGMSLKAFNERMAQLGSQGGKITSNLAQNFALIGQEAKKTVPWINKIKTSLADSIRYIISANVVNKIIGTLTSAYSYVKNIDTSLNNIRIVTGKSADEMTRFAQEANKVAQSLGKTTKEYTDASLIFYQQGLSDEEVKARTKVTLKASNVTGQNTDTVSQQLTAIWNGFQVAAQDTEKYVDKLAAVAATTASDLNELSTAMQKVASAANATGTNVDQLTAQIATIVSVTREAPESVGTALKTLYARMSQFKLGESDEDGVTLGQYTQAMANMGIQVLDETGNLRDLGSVMEDVADKWGELAEAQKMALAQQIGGTRQYNYVYSLMENWGMYEEALQTAQNAEGTLNKQQSIHMETVAAHLAQLTTASEKLYQTLLEPEGLNGLIDALTVVLKIVSEITGAFGGMEKIMIAIGGIALKSFAPKFSQAVSARANNKIVDFRNAQNKKNIDEYIQSLPEWKDTNWDNEDSEIIEEIKRFEKFRLNHKLSQEDDARVLQEEKQRIEAIKLKNKLSENRDYDFNKIKEQTNLDLNASTYSDIEEAFKYIDVEENIKDKDGSWVAPLIKDNQEKLISDLQEELNKKEESLAKASLEKENKLASMRQLAHDRSYGVKAIDKKGTREEEEYSKLEFKNKDELNNLQNNIDEVLKERDKVKEALEKAQNNLNNNIDDLKNQYTESIDKISKVNNYEVKDEKGKTKNIEILSQKSKDAVTRDNNKYIKEIEKFDSLQNQLEEKRIANQEEIIKLKEEEAKIDKEIEKIENDKQFIDKAEYDKNENRIKELEKRKKLLEEEKKVKIEANNQEDEEKANGTRKRVSNKYGSNKKRINDIDEEIEKINKEKNDLREKNNKKNIDEQNYKNQVAQLKKLREEKDKLAKSETASGEEILKLEKQIEEQQKKVEDAATKTADSINQANDEIKTFLSKALESGELDQAQIDNINKILNTNSKGMTQNESDIDITERIKEQTEAWSNLAGSVMQYTASLSAIFNISDIINNDDVSILEKIISIITIAGAALSSIIGISKALNAIKSEEIGLTLKSILGIGTETAARNAATGATKAQTGATEELTVAEKMATAAGGPLVLILTAITAAVGIMVACFDSYNRTLLENAEASAKAAEENRELLNELENSEDLVKAYQELFRAYEEGEASKEQLIDASSALEDQLGAERVAVAQLTEDWKELNSQANEYRGVNLGDQKEQAEEALKNSYNALMGRIDASDSWILNGGSYFGATRLSNENMLSIQGNLGGNDIQTGEKFNEYLQSKGFEGNVFDGGFIQLDLSSEESFYNSIKALEDLDKVLSEADKDISSDWINSGMQEEIKDFLSRLDEDDWLQNFKNDYELTKNLETKISTFNASSSISSLGDYLQEEEKLIKELQEEEGLSPEDAKKKIQKAFKEVDSSFSDYITKANYISSLGNINKQVKDTLINNINNLNVTDFAELIKLGFNAEYTNEHFEEIIQMIHAKAEKNKIELQVSVTDNALESLMAGSSLSEDQIKQLKEVASAANIEIDWEAFNLESVVEQTRIINQLTEGLGESYYKAAQEARNYYQIITEGTTKKDIEKEIEDLEKQKQKLKNKDNYRGYYSPNLNNDEIKKETEQIIENIQNDIKEKELILQAHIELENADPIHDWLTGLEAEVQSVETTTTRISKAIELINEDFSVSADNVVKFLDEIPTLAKFFDVLEDGSLKVKNSQESALQVAIQGEYDLQKVRRETMIQDLTNEKVKLEKLVDSYQREYDLAVKNFNSGMSLEDHKNKVEEDFSEERITNETIEQKQWMQDYLERLALLQDIQAVLNGGTTSRNWTGYQVTNAEAVKKHQEDDLESWNEYLQNLAFTIERYNEDIKTDTEELSRLLAADEISKGAFSTAKKAEEALDNVAYAADVFFDINNQIERLNHNLTILQKQSQFLSGDAAVKNLEKQAKIYKQLENSANIKGQIAANEMARMRQDGLSKSGVSAGIDSSFFDADGQIAKGKYLERYNKLFIAVRDASSKEAREEAQERLDAFTDYINEYEGYYQEMLAQQESWLDNWISEQSARIETTKLTFQAELDTKELKKSLINFQKNFSINITKMFSTDTLMNEQLKNGTFAIDTLKVLFGNGSEKGEIQTKTEMVQQGNEIVKAIIETGQKQVWNGIEYGLEDIEALKDAIKEFETSLEDSLADAQEQMQSLEDAYLTSIDKFGEAVSNLNESNTFIQNWLQHGLKEIELVKGMDATASKALAQAFYEVAAEQNMNTAIEMTSSKAEAAELLETALQTYENDNSLENEEAAAKAYENYKNICEMFNASVENALSSAWDSYTNAVQVVLDESKIAMFGTNDINDIVEQWDLVNKKSEVYLDTLNAEYEVQKLQNKYAEAINSNLGDPRIQEKINNAMDEELDILKQKDKLTQHDIDRANAKYELTLKQIALEEAQNNKTNLRMRRDSQGNYSFQYTANEDDILKAEGDLLGAQQNVWNIDKDYLKTTKDEVLSLTAEMYEKINEIALDKGMTPEQRTAAMEEVYDNYTKIINDYAKESEYVWGQCKEDVVDATEIGNEAVLNSFTELKKAVIGNGGEASDGIVGDMVDKSVIALNDLIAKFTGEDDSLDAKVKACFSKIEQTGREYDDFVNNLTDGLGDQDPLGAILGGWEDIQAAIVALANGQSTTNGEDAGGENYWEKLIGDIESIKNAFKKYLVDDSDSVIKIVDEVKSKIKSMFDWKNYAAKVIVLKGQIENFIGTINDLGTAWDNAREAAKEYYEYTANQKGTDVKPETYTGEGGSSGSQKGGGKTSSGKDDNSINDVDTTIIEEENKKGRYNITNGYGVEMQSDSLYDQKVLAQIYNNGSKVFDNKSKEAVHGIIANLKGTYKLYDDSIIRGVVSQKTEKDLVEEYKKKYGSSIKFFDTGGYTGQWNSSDGKLAMLHEKELVLNKEDTENILAAVGMVRDVATMLSNMSSNIFERVFAFSASKLSDSKADFNQNVTITAEFKDATTHNEIEEALNSLVNAAYQKAWE